jgi:hypothetical protein
MKRAPAYFYKTEKFFIPLQKEHGEETFAIGAAIHRACVRYQRNIVLYYKKVLKGFPFGEYKKNLFFWSKGVRGPPPVYTYPMEGVDPSTNGLIGKFL